MKKVKEIGPISFAIDKIKNMKFNEKVAFLIVHSLFPVFAAFVIYTHFYLLEKAFNFKWFFGGDFVFSLLIFLIAFFCSVIVCFEKAYVKHISKNKTTAD